MAKNLPSLIVYATDISPSALEVAKANCRCHGVAGKVYLKERNLLDPLEHSVDLIAANLPYVSGPELAKLSDEIRYLAFKGAHCPSKGEAQSRRGNSAGNQPLQRKSRG